MPQFEISTYPSQIFWLVICFAALCLVMTRYLVPRLTASLQKREQHLWEDWEKAKDLQEAAESLRQENLTHLAEARKQAHILLHQVMQEIYHRKTARIAILDEELTLKATKARKDLEAQTQKILTNIDPIVSQIVKGTSLCLLGQSLTQLEAKELVQNVLKKRKTS